MAAKTTNVFIAGVGGQGIILASEILSDAALAKGLDVKKSEVHGMAQRGGSVVSHVRFGVEVHSPVITAGEADLLVSFERMEALRWVQAIAPDGKIIVNTQEIVPSGQETYPKDIDSQMDERAPGTLRIDALKLAKEAGHIRAVNVVMLGAMSHFLDFTAEEWKAAIEARVPKKSIEINLKAFELGRRAVAS